MDRAVGPTLQGTQPAQRGSQGWGEKHHSLILLLLPDPNWMDPIYSQRAKSVSSADHGCHQVGEGGRKEGWIAGLQGHVRMAHEVASLATYYPSTEFHQFTW